VWFSRKHRDNTYINHNKVLFILRKNYNELFLINKLISIDKCITDFAQFSLCMYLLFLYKRIDVKQNTYYLLHTKYELPMRNLVTFGKYSTTNFFLCLFNIIINNYICKEITWRCNKSMMLFNSLTNIYCWSNASRFFGILCI